MLKKILKISLIVILLIIVITLGSCAWLAYKMPQILSETNLRTEMYEDIQQQLGFQHRVEYFEENGDKKLYISEITPGKTFEKAGFKIGDQADYPYKYSSDFFKLFALNQEKQITVPIIRDGKQLNIVVGVPKLEFQVDPYELHYPFLKPSK